MLEHYLSLFLDSLLVSTFIPTDGEDTLRTMLYYGTYPRVVVLLISVTGAVAGLTCNWLAGRAVYALTSRTKAFIPLKARYARCTEFANKYALILVSIALFNQAEAALTLTAGMLKVKLAMFLAVVLIAKFVYFTLYIYVF